jgi:hypothetical protein
VGYSAETQAWQKIPGIELWCGAIVGKLPDPGRLQRSQTLSGHDVKLGDGNLWTVPAARRLDATFGLVSAVPTKYSLGDDGGWVAASVVEQYRRLYDIGTEFYELITAKEIDEEGGKRVTVEDSLDWCCEILAANYRLGKAEVSLLGLLTTATMGEILNACIDMPTIRSKKKSQLTSAAGGSDY